VSLAQLEHGGLPRIQLVTNVDENVVFTALHRLPLDLLVVPRKA
jgi:hypothetical protein